MKGRLLLVVLTVALAACVSPTTAGPWACRDEVRTAMTGSYGLARLRDDQRAVILLPAGKAAADYERETARLRADGARLAGALEANDPEGANLPAPIRPVLNLLTSEQVARQSAAADACIAAYAR